MTNIVVNGYKRITKVEAKKQYNQYKIIYLVPCKILPDYKNFWIQPFDIKRKIDLRKPDGITWDKWTFDKEVNSFEYYNCQHNELGKYTSFYIKEEQNNEITIS